MNLKPLAGADPGFPVGGGADPPGGGAPTYDFVKISQNMHEIEKILDHRGGRAPGAPPSLDPPLTSCNIVILDNFDHTFQKNGYMADLVLTSHKARYFM